VGLTLKGRRPHARTRRREEVDLCIVVPAENLATAVTAARLKKTFGSFVTRMICHLSPRRQMEVCTRVHCHASRHTRSAGHVALAASHRPIGSRENRKRASERDGGGRRRRKKIIKEGHPIIIPGPCRASYACIIIGLLRHVAGMAPVLVYIYCWSPHLAATVTLDTALLRRALGLLLYPGRTTVRPTKQPALITHPREHLPVVKFFGASWLAVCVCVRARVRGCACVRTSFPRE